MSLAGTRDLKTLHLRSVTEHSVSTLQHKLINPSLLMPDLLMPEENENITEKDMGKIELEGRK